LCRAQETAPKSLIASAWVSKRERKRRNPVNPSVFIFGCAALFAAFIFSHICVYKLGKYQGWKEAVRQYMHYEKAGMSLDDGETLAAAVELRKGTYFFIGLDTKNSSRYE
jgi:hypothetical protein